MAALILPRILTAQPQYAAQIDPEYGKDATLNVNFAVGARNAVSGEYPVGTFTGAQQTTNAAGRAYKNAGAAGSLFWPVKSVIGTDKWTLLYHFYLPVAGAVAQGYLQLANNSSATSGSPFLLINNDGAGNLRLYVNNGYQIIASGVLTDRSYHALAITYDGANVTMIRNGSVVGTYASADLNASAGARPSDRLWIGSGFPAAADIEVPAVHYKMGATPVRQLCALTAGGNIYPIFQAPPRKIWAGIAATATSFGGALRLQSSRTAQPQQAAPLNPQYAKWEWVFSGPTGARNFGNSGVNGSFSGTSGARRYSDKGVGYGVGTAPSAAGGLQVTAPAATPTVYSGLIVFSSDAANVGLDQALFDSNPINNVGFYVKVRINGLIEIDRRNLALIALSDSPVKPGINVVAWTHDLNNLTFALNGAVKTVSDPSTVYAWNDTPSFGSTYLNESVEHQQLLSAMTVTQSLTAAELVSLTLNPWQIFRPPPRRLWVAAPAVQLLRPSSDISAGTWAPSSGVTLFSMLNEAVASDATYVLTSQPSTFAVGLTAGVNPGVTTGHIVRTRTIGAVTVSLMQGATVIASWAQNSLMFTTFEQTLTSVQAAAITNYAALSTSYRAT